MQKHSRKWLRKLAAKARHALTKAEPGRLKRQKEWLSKVAERERRARNSRISDYESPRTEAQGAE